MRRSICQWWRGAIAVAAILLPQAAAADQPAHEIQVTAKKFSFEPAAIQVVAGEPVRLVLKSADSVHGFAIHELKIDVTIPKGGQTVTVEFTAPPVGRYEIACSEFCGAGHGQMRAALVSVAPPIRTPNQAATWLFGAAAAADWATTIHYLEFHHGREDNPLINWTPTPSTTVALGAMLDVASYALWRRLTIDHPRLANTGLYLASAFRFSLAARNEYRIARGGACSRAPCQYNCAAVFSGCS